MPSLASLLKGTAARIPGLAALGATGWVATSVTDPTAGPAFAVALTVIGAMSLAAQAPYGGELPRAPAGADPGAFLVGHTRRDRGGGAVSLPWGGLDKGLAVIGAQALRADLLAGIALQSMAVGRATLILSFSPGRPLWIDAIREAVRRVGLDGDLWDFAAIDGERLEPFAGLDPRIVSELVANACGGFGSDAGGRAQARLLLQAAAALYGHYVSKGLADPTPDEFERHLRLRSLRAGASPDMELPVEVSREVTRYLDSLPGYVDVGKQPASVQALHSTAECILLDGLAVIRGACLRNGPAVGGGDLLSAGRASILASPADGGGMRKTAFLIDLIATLLTSRPGLKPIVIVDGIDAMPADLGARILDLRRLGAGVACGMNPATGEGPSPQGLILPTRIVESARADRPWELVGEGGKGRRLFPLPLSEGQLLIERKRRSAPRISLQIPPRDPEEARVPVDVLSRLLEAEPEQDLPPADAIVARLSRWSSGTEASDADRSASLLLAEIARDAVERRKGAPDRGGRFNDLELPETGFDDWLTSPKGDLSAKDFDLDLSGFDAGLDFGDFPGDPVDASNGSTGHVVFPSCLRDDPGLGDGPWHRVAGTDIGQALVADPDVVAFKLDGEFPHFASVTERVVASLRKRGANGFGPMLLHGPGGIGKTRYARRLFEALGVPWSSYSCGGAADASFLGAGRQWSGARPGYLAALMARERAANPGIVLDGIDAVADGRGNGSLLDGLPALLDPETSARYHDPYLDAPIDASGVLWIATAQDIAKLPPGFRDLFRDHAVSEPAPEHIEVLVASILKDLARRHAEWGDPAVRERVMAALGHWEGGSIRKLRRLVEDAVETLPAAPQAMEA